MARPSNPERAARIEAIHAVFPKYDKVVDSIASRTEETGVTWCPAAREIIEPNGKQLQERKVLDYIMAHGGITQMQAGPELNVWRLAAVVSKLRNKGYPIIKVDHPMKRGGNYAEYRMEGETNETV